MLKQTSYVAKGSNSQASWYTVDATGVVLGRLATQIAMVLRGKNKPTFTPGHDGGDFVVVLNADKVKLTGNKLANKVYYRHSGYLGGIKQITAGDLLKKEPEALLRKAVQGMLPKGPLGKSLLKKLKIYCDTTHPHAAQKPQPLKLDA